ncbi:MAG: hypothetical protein EBU84_21900, partial [Actinobacteria bacterium]|nr:hypothetical protein [Actinomycetota bacterium]
VAGARLSISENELIVTDTSMIPYECLSTGRKMKIDIEICKTLQKLLGARAPGFYFIDDYDLLDADAKKHLPVGSQVFIAKVSSEAQGLQIFDMG